MSGKRNPRQMRKVQKSHFHIPLELKIIFKCAHSDVFIIACILRSHTFSWFSGSWTQRWWLFLTGCSLALFSFPVLEWDCPLGTAKSTSSIRIIWSHEEAAPMNSFSFLLIHPDFTMMMLSVTGLHVVPLASHSFLSSWLCRAEFGASRFRWHVGWNCPL